MLDPIQVNLNDVKGTISPSRVGFQVKPGSTSALKSDRVWTKYGLQQLVFQLQRVVDQMKAI